MAVLGKLLSVLVGFGALFFLIALWENWQRQAPPKKQSKIVSLKEWRENKGKNHKSKQKPRKRKNKQKHGSRPYEGGGHAA